MKPPPISLATLTHAERARFHAMTSAPALAWPTVALWAFVLTVYACTDVLAVLGVLPLWQGLLINSAVGYFAFSVVHDSIHRAISTNARLNDFLGQTAAVLGAPYVHLKLFRWAHISHHRFTNGPRDPDNVLHGAAWTLPLRWMSIDVLYLAYALRHGDKVSRSYVVLSLWLAAATALVVGVLASMGYGWHIVMLWFIPSRLIFLGLGFSFFWLPHLPHDTVQDDNFTRATTLRLGYEWLLSPALQWQNYHLIHHMYPTTPFYNNSKVWRLLEPELRKQDLAIQHGFALYPTIYLGAAE
jgi:beta-carotene hydroxylase